MSEANEFAPATLEQWAKAAAKSAPGGDPARLNWVTPEGISVGVVPVPRVPDAGSTLLLLGAALAGLGVFRRRIK